MVLDGRELRTRRKKQQQEACIESDINKHRATCGLSSVPENVLCYSIDAALCVDILNIVIGGWRCELIRVIKIDPSQILCSAAFPFGCGVLLRNSARTEGVLTE